MNTDEKDEVVQLYLDDIIPNRFQPREIFDERALKELAVSIKEHGVIQPIIVRSVKNGKYEIIAGERRYKASALAGLTKIPAIIRNLDDKESSKVALLENLQRKNLNPIEEARTYQKILEIDQMTQEELARTMGKSQSAVANKIRLLSLSDTVQDALLKEQISERHARALLNITDSKEQKEMLKKIIDTKMSVRALEEELKGETKQEETQEQIASASAFVNNNPLIPTADLPEDNSNYGKVTIAPPEEEKKENTNKFINFDNNENEVVENTSTENNPLITDNETKEENINKSNNLDSLLNVDDSSRNFITPAEEIVKTNLNNNMDEISSDYFQMPEELSSMNNDDNPIINPMNNNMFLTQQVPSTEENNMFAEPNINNSEQIEIKPEENEKYTVEQASEKIKDLIEDLKNHGITLKTDEMNFEKSYQIIIKIDKNEIKE